MGYVPDVMRKSVYDANDNQKVDNAEAISGYTIVGDVGWCFE